MKLKSVITCLLASAALAGCAMSETAEGGKKKLAEKGYTVTIMAEAEYKTTNLNQKIAWDSSMQNYMLAENGKEHGYLFAWYFVSIDSANSWNEGNRLKLLDIQVDDKDAELTTGIHNNCVWLGTHNAAKTAGYTMID